MDEAALGGSERSSAPVTLCIPVYNGERFLSRAISSVLSQSVPPSELRVFDNASTDATVSVAEQMLPAGSVIRSDRNLGAAANFRRAFEGTQTRYFMWLAADDELDPEFIASTMARLEDDSSLPACLTAVELIDAQGKRLGVHLDSPMASVKPQERLRCLVRHRRWVEFYCLYRTEALASAPFARSTHGTDILLTWWLLLRGPLAVIPDPLFRYRVVNKTVVESDAAIEGVNSGTTHWRKLRLWRTLWAMAGEPGVDRAVTRVARRELLLVLCDEAWWHHFAEDVFIRWPRFGRQVLRITAALRAVRHRN
jgi:glycosyltransferase involved in cell wall biosynthesis